MRIDEITIGTRHRRDPGDVAALARSIAEVGLLHPVVVTPAGVLIAGERRLAAAKVLGWTDVPTTVVDLAEIVRGEWAENAERKDFLPSEIEAIRLAMAPVEQTAAKERMSEGAKGKETFLTLPGQTRDKIAAFAGVSGRTVEKIARVAEAARAEPQRFGPLVEEMDRTGKVDRAYSQVRRAQKHEAIAEKAASCCVLSHLGPFPPIYADPV